MQETQLLQFDTVKSTLLSKGLKDSLSRDFERLQIPGDTDAESSDVQEWLKWSRARTDVQCVDAPVPPDIMPGALLVDIKVGSAGRRRKPDDSIYNRNSDIRRRVARGNCVLQLRDGRSLCLTHALKKFTGGMGDEDDDSTGGDDSTWRRYFLRPLEEAARLVLTRKANGEAAHLSARHVDGAFLVCVGSKNVHMVLRAECDLALYDGPRYRVAREVAAAVWRLLAALDDGRRQLLLSFLHHTRFTAVMELLQPDHQSIEDLSNLKEAELHFIAWAPTFSPDVTSYCGCSPELGFQLAEMFGLKTVSHSVVTGDVVSRLPEVMQEIREGCGYEGNVLYFVDDEDNVIGLLKRKTTWYMLLRALRDLLCAGLKKRSLEELRSDIERRFRVIQARHSLDDRLLNNWLSLGFAFAHWMKENVRTDRRAPQMMIPPLWSQFLCQTGRTDRLKTGATGGRLF